MKKVIPALIVMILVQFQCKSMFAQAPQAFPYQSVLRDASGNLLANQNVSLRFSILSGSATGNMVYQETQTAITNHLGLFNVNIGQGIVTNGSFGSINWGSGSKYLKVELDATGGSNYVVMDNAQLLSVPYALFAGNSSASIGQWTTSGNNIYNSNSGNVGIGTTSPVSKLQISNTNGGTDFQGLNIYSNGSNLNYFDIYSDNTANTSGSLLRLVTRNTAGLTTTSTDLVKYKNGVFAINNYETDPSACIAFSLGANAPERMRIASNGNVGIGTNSPQSKLDVAGQIRISGGAPGEGKVLTSDANGLASWQNNTASTTHYIGESYGGGIVFFVYDNGQHGLIAANSDICTNCGGSSQIVSCGTGCGLRLQNTPVIGDGIGAGLSNSLFLIDQNRRNVQTSSSAGAGASNAAVPNDFAPYVAINYSSTQSGIKYGDWYLPSLYELQLLYLNRNSVGGFFMGTSICNGEGYLTSENPPGIATHVYTITFGDGLTHSDGCGNQQTIGGRVRPIRRF